MVAGACAGVHGLRQAAGRCCWGGHPRRHVMTQLTLGEGGSEFDAAGSSGLAAPLTPIAAEPDGVGAARLAA